MYQLAYLKELVMHQIQYFKALKVPFYEIQVLPPFWKGHNKLNPFWLKIAFLFRNFTRRTLIVSMAHFPIEQSKCFRWVVE